MTNDEETKLAAVIADSDAEQYEAIVGFIHLVENETSISIKDISLYEAQQVIADFGQ